MARLVLYELAGHAHEDGSGIWAAQPTLAREAGIGRSTVQRALDGDPRREPPGGLVAAGLVETKLHGGKNGTNLYRVRLCALCLPGMQKAATGNGRPLPASHGSRPRIPRMQQPASQGGRNTVLEHRQEDGARPSADAAGAVDQPRGEPAPADFRAELAKLKAER
jgi:hypothetical protein